MVGLRPVHLSVRSSILNRSLSRSIAFHYSSPKTRYLGQLSSTISPLIWTYRDWTWQLFHGVVSLAVFKLLIIEKYLYIIVKYYFIIHLFIYLFAVAKVKWKEREREIIRIKGLMELESRDWNPWRATPGRGSHTFRQGFFSLPSYLLDVGSVFND